MKEMFIGHQSSVISGQSPASVVALFFLTSLKPGQAHEVAPRLRVWLSHLFLKDRKSVPFPRGDEE
jgi:hypothetical protein